ncbi:MAG: HupE/UreJ family protein [Oxalobacteraceae bacterium]
MTFLRWLAACLMLCGMQASAHQSGNSYLRIDSDAQAVRVQLDFAVRDLNSLLQIPPEQQKPIQRDELAALQGRLTDVIASSLSLEVDGQPLSLAFQSQEVALHNDGLYVRQSLSAAVLDPQSAQLLVRYGFFNEEEKIARAFVKLSANGLETSAVFDARHAVQRLPLREISLTEILGSYAREGALHIWSGLDHLLFLFCLLLPGLSLSASSSRPLLMYAIKVVTAFTVAHSFTLAAAALEWVVLPDKLIEIAIAASIIISALMNLWRGKGAYQWKLAFGFGLIHGLGFANGLRELGLSSSHFIETLLAFNLGVEFGQMAVVLAMGLVLAPVLHRERAVSLIQRWGSVGILLMACGWLVERMVG